MVEMNNCGKSISRFWIRMIMFNVFRFLKCYIFWSDDYTYTSIHIITKNISIRVYSVLFGFHESYNYYIMNCRRDDVSYDVTATLVKL